MWASSGLDNFSRWMEMMVLGLLVLDLTDSAWKVALVAALRWTPMAGFGLVSGFIADRVNRWRVVALARSVSVLAMAALFILVISDGIQPWHIFLGAMVLGWAFVLDWPSRRSFVYDLVGSERIVNAMSLETINSNIGKILGPLMAGLLIELAGFTVAFLFLLLTSIFSLVFVSLVKSRIGTSRPSSQSMLQSIASGISFSLGNSVILSLLVVTIIMNLTAMSAIPLYPVVARDHLHVGAGLTGVMVSAEGMGTLIGAMGLFSLQNVQHHGRIFVVSSMWWLAALSIFALSPWYGLSTLMMLLVGLGASGYMTMQVTIVLLSAPPEMRGRALGTLGLFIGVGPLGTLEAGALAVLLTAPAAISINAVAGLLLLIPVVVLAPLVWRSMNSALPAGGQPRVAPVADIPARD